VRACGRDHCSLSLNQSKLFGKVLLQDFKTRVDGITFVLRDVGRLLCVVRWSW
jgi:hypothetical protein